MSQTGQPWSPQTSSCISSNQGVHWALPGVSFSALQPGNSLKAVSCGSLRNYLVHMQLLQITFLICLMCSTLKTCRFTYFVCFVAVVIASDKKVNQHPLYLGCKAKLTCIHLKILSVVIENRDWFVSTPHHSATCCFHFFKN